jgi:DNA-binding GntR family transcriptional regulator
MSRTVEKAYDYILTEIVSGRAGAGTHLRETELAEALEVSRTPIREALRRLETEGLVTVERNAGAAVAVFSRDEVVEIYWLRAMLEGHAAARAATRITAEELVELGRLADALDKMQHQDPIDIVAFADLNTRFHLAIAKAAHSVRLYALIRSVIRLPIVLLQQPEWRSRLRRAAGYAHHHAIIDALKAGNAGWAESQMQTHIFASLPAQR